MINFNYLQVYIKILRMIRQDTFQHNLDYST